MKITVLGSGCPTCGFLYEWVKKLADEKKINAEVEYISDVMELVNRGITGSPALLIDDKPVYVGMPKNEEELMKIIQENSE